MRRYLIDEWRRSPRADFVSPPSDLVARGRNLDLEIEVDRLLEDLAEVNPELCHVVELKHYLGLTDEETADALGLKLHTMQRRWRDAREWLFSRLEKKHAEQIAG
jgi:DNA-directed RNA polymerase specialized sigma24 family protein